jgi:hypothetical protein
MWVQMRRCFARGAFKGVRAGRLKLAPGGGFLGGRERRSVVLFCLVVDFMSGRSHVRADVRGDKQDGMDSCHSVGVFFFLCSYLEISASPRWWDVLRFIMLSLSILYVICMVYLLAVRPERAEGGKERGDERIGKENAVCSPTALDVLSRCV